MGALARDLTSAWRTMRRNRGITIVVVLSLGLAIGANTAVFSTINAFLLRPLPVKDIDRVVRVRENFAAPGLPPDVRSVSAANLGRWQRESSVFEGMAAATGTNLTLTGAGDPERVSGALISANFFPVLGIQPYMGRNFLKEEDQPGRDNVVLLAYGLWKTHFGGDQKILGKVLILNGQARTVVGIMPRGLRHPYEADMWVPLAYREDAANTQEYYVPARLKPGITLERARVDMDTFVRHVAEQDTRPTAPKGADLSPLRGELVANLDKMLFLLSAAAAFVLLIACANISNLLLAQSLNQSTEVAVRAALGATRGNLIRQYLTYSVLLALAGSALGLVLALWSVKPLVSLSPVYALGEFDIEPRIDLPTLGFTFLAALVVGVVFGLIPALRVSKVSLNNSLRESGRSKTMTVGGRRLLGSFVIAEVALALMLLVGAGLMFRSFQQIQDEDRGFNRHDLLTFVVPFAEVKFPEREQKVAFIRELMQRLRSLPGVVSAGGSTVQPLYAGSFAASFNVEGRPASDERGYHITHTRTVTPGYLEAMKIPLLAGRYLAEQDIEDRPLSVVISKSFADRYWPGESAVGKRVKRGIYSSERPWLTVVGVVGTLKETEDEVTTNSDAWYLPYPQPIIADLDSMVFVLRTQGNPTALLPAVRETVGSIDKDQPIYDVATMEQRFYDRTTTERFSAALYGLLGLLGLALAAIGIYAVLAFSVTQRLREIGIRSALGARPVDVKRMILRNGLGLMLAGLGIGTLGTLLLTKSLSSQLYLINPRDPVTLAAALTCLAAIALISTYIPAERASKIDPIRALRQE